MGASCLHSNQIWVHGPAPCKTPVRPRTHNAQPRRAQPAWAGPTLGAPGLRRQLSSNPIASRPSAPPGTGPNAPPSLALRSRPIRPLTDARLRMFPRRRQAGTARISAAAGSTRSRARGRVRMVNYCQPCTSAPSHLTTIVFGGAPPGEQAALSTGSRSLIQTAATCDHFQGWSPP
jgi:hypothetical protein